MIDREQIIRMAREADREWDCDRDMVEWLEWFAALVAAAERDRIADEAKHIIKRAEARGAAAEREACAKVCEDKAMHCETKAQEAIEAGEHDEVSAIRSTAWQISVCAAAIRARGQA